MKIVEHQDAILSNYEVLSHVLKKSSDFAKRVPKSLDKVERQKHALPQNVSEILNTTRVGLSGPATVLQNGGKYSAETIEALFLELKQFKLEKAEYLMILNIRPRNLPELNLVIEEVDTRFAEEEQQWKILEIIGRHLGHGDYMPVHPDRRPQIESMARMRGDSIRNDAAELRKQFEKEDFNAVSFLNEVVPPVAPSAVIQALPTQSRARAEPIPANAQSLSQISAVMHKLLSQISVRHTALSNELTQATDDILRSGGRLEYEVDVLKGEVNGLHEILTERLEGDIDRFAKNPNTQSAESDGELAGLVDPRDAALPPELAQLKMLLTVRSRLEAVVKVFGDESFAKEMAEQRKTSR